LGFKITIQNINNCETCFLKALSDNSAVKCDPNSALKVLIYSTKIQFTIFYFQF